MDTNKIILFLLAYAGYWTFLQFNHKVLNCFFTNLITKKFANMKINPKKTMWEKDFAELNLGRSLQIFRFAKPAFFLGILFFWKPIFEVPAIASWIWFPLSIGLFVWWWDLSFFILHRFVFHSKIGFKLVHYVHHRFRDPVMPVRAAFSLWEFAALEVFGALTMFLFPIHFLAVLIGRDFCINIINILNHLGYETFPEGFPKHPVFKYLTTSTHHSLHHAHFNCNYALLINYDLIFGTVDKVYYETFAKIKARDHAVDIKQSDAV